PPSESTLPASSTRPSATRSATTLLTEPELRPVIGPSSKRLRGPSKYSRWSTSVRLLRLRSRTVRPFRPVMWLPSTVFRPATYPCEEGGRDIPPPLISRNELSEDGTDRVDWYAGTGTERARAAPHAEAEPSPLRRRAPRP